MFSKSIFLKLCLGLSLLIPNLVLADSVEGYVCTLAVRSYNESVLGKGGLYLQISADTTCKNNLRSVYVGTQGSSMCSVYSKTEPMMLQLAEMLEGALTNHRLLAFSLWDACIMEITYTYAP